MKYILSLLVAVFFLTACGNQDVTWPTDLAGKKQLLTTKKQAIKTLEADLAKLKSEIAELDTTQRVITRKLVTTQIIKKADFERFVEIQAAVESGDAVKASSETGGRIISLNVKEGQNIRRGQIIANLDMESVNKQIAELETSLELAEDVFTRQKRLWDQNIGSEMQLLQAKNNKESLENSIKTLQTQAGMSTVRAPFAGTVDDVMPKIGEMASPGMPVARIVNVGDVYLKAEISERYLGKVDVGDSVEVEFPGVYETMAVVKRTGSYINPNSRSFEVIVDIPNKNAVLKPNMLAKLKINDYTANETVVLPSSMIQQDTRGNSFIYTLEQMGDKKKVKKIEIETGLDYDGKTEIVKGLEDVAAIVDKGARQVANGEEVEVQ